MAISDWLTIKSNKQIQEETKEFERKIFPLGDEEKEKVKDLLLKFNIKKIGASTLLYDFITLKQTLFLSKESDNDYAIWYHSPNVKILSTNDKSRLKALVILDNELNDLNSFPTLEQVDQKAKDYINDPIPEKRHKKLLRF